MISEGEKVHREALRTLIREGFPDALLLEDCTDGAQVLPLAIAQQPDILMLSVDMPDPKALETIRQLRQSGYPGKIVVHTACDSFSCAQDVLSSGADAFLLKPVQGGQLVATIKGLAGKAAQPPLGMGGQIAKELCDYLIPEYLFDRGRPCGDRKNLWHYLVDNLASVAFVQLSVSQEVRMMLHLKQDAFRDPFEQIGQLIREKLPNDFKLLRLPNLDGSWVLFHFSTTPVPAALLGLRAAHMACRMLLMVLLRQGVYLQSAVEISSSGLKGCADVADKLKAGIQTRTIDQLLMDQPMIREALLPVEEARRLMENCTQGPYWTKWLDEGPYPKEDAAGRFARGAALLLSLQAALCQGERDQDKGASRGWNGAMGRRFPQALRCDLIDEWANDSAQEALQQYCKRSQRVPQLVLRRACTYMKENYHTDLSLQQVAEYAGVSASYLSHQFKNKLGMGFVDYLQGIRMQQLMRLLRQKDYSVRELSQLLGYNSHTYFCRVVRRRTGATINQLKRRLAREQLET